MPELICDTSPIQYLHQLHFLEILPGLSEKIILPQAVVHELDRGRKQGADLPEIASIPWITTSNCDSESQNRRTRMFFLPPAKESEIVGMTSATPLGQGEQSEIQWRCLKCLAPNSSKSLQTVVGPWTCANCGETQPAHPEALNETGEIRGCAVCGCPDIYRQRDFNRKLGITIIVIGAVLAPFTKWISLVVCALIDFAIYKLIPDVVVCYHCHAILRRYPGTEKVQPFDLNTSDKYIDVERKRGW